jgi:hypothetical protein
MSTENKLSSVAIFVPYFGKLPNYFPLWLTSCRYNPTIDWFIFTDDKTPFDYPPNVHVRYCTFDDIRHLLQKPFEFPIALNRPYKLCDFKPAYGEAFAEYCRGYDFWGYCEVDLLFGNIRHFITEEILREHDRVFSIGFVSLYRNTKRITELYRSKIEGPRPKRVVELFHPKVDGWRPYERAFSIQKNTFFEERGPHTIHAVCKSAGIALYDQIVYADIRIESHHFELTHWHIDSAERRKQCSIFLFSEGKLSRFFIENGELCQNEYSHIHLQKRPMDIELSQLLASSFLIVPNKFIDYNGNLRIEDVRKLGRFRGIYYHNARRVFKDRSKSLCSRWIRTLLGI